MKVYTAKTGDMWDSIALALYGDEKKSTEIMAVNPRLVDIIIFSGGERVLLPDNIKMAEPLTLPPWRR